MSCTGTVPHRKEPGREETTETTRHMQKGWWVNRVIMGMLSENPIAFQIKLDDGARCVRQAQENGAYFWRFRLGYFMYVVPGYEEAWKFGKHQDSPSGHGGTYPRSTAFAEYSLHPVRQKMVTSTINWVKTRRG